MTGLAGHAAFLDRDGILNCLVPDPHTGMHESPHHPDEVRLEAGAETVSALSDLGAVLIVASNQPAVAKGTLSWGALQAVHQRVDDLLQQAGVRIQRYAYCYHHPEARVQELRGPCECRKPSPGLLVQAAHAADVETTGSWMIGDSDTDVAAGQRAGCQTALVANPGSGHRRAGACTPDIWAPNLSSAVAQIVARIR